LRAARANHAFHEIAAYARTRFTSAHKRRSARTGRRPRKPCADLRAARMRLRAGDKQSLRAARANRVFHAEVKRVRAENTVTYKSNNGPGLLFHKIAAGARTRSISAHQRRSARMASRPRNIAKSQ